MTSRQKFGLVKYALDAGDVDVASYLSGTRHKELTKERAKAMADNRTSPLLAALTGGLTGGGLSALAGYGLTDPRVYSDGDISNQPKTRNAIIAGLMGSVVGAAGGGISQAYKNEREREQLRTTLG